MATRNTELKVAEAEPTLTKEMVASLPLRKLLVEFITTQDNRGREVIERRESWIEHQVVAPMKGEDGRPIMEKSPKTDSLVFRTETLPLSADTLLSFRVDGEFVWATTIDGQKLRAPLPK